MTISVVIAAYNGSSYIAEQLESICTQLLPPDEVVISDDNSTDQTRKIVEEIAEKFPQIKIIFSVNPAPDGVDKNFERAISLATGNVIFICDQDDIWLPGRLKIMAGVLNEPLSGTFCDSKIVDHQLNDLGYTHLFSRGFKSYDKLFTVAGKDFLKRVPAAGHDMAFTADLKEILLPFPDLKNCYDTWIGLVLFALGAWKPCTSEPLTLFRRHAGAVSGSGFSLSFREKIAQAKKAVADDASGWYAELYHQLIERVKDKAAPEMLSLLEKRRIHSLRRSRMNTALPGRLFLVMLETLNGNYFRFGRSWQNIVQDIFLRRQRAAKG